MRTDAIVGREEELAAIHSVLDGTDRALRALVLEGEAGAGKSILWEAGVEAARQRGLRVLSSRPAEAERALAYVVLGDLLEEVVEEVRSELPAPQRSALEVALLTTQAPDHALDPRALGVAVRSCLRLLAADTTVVLALDDSHWLDASSAGALAFALRRLRTEPLLLLLARRPDGEANAAVLETIVEPPALERVHVGALSVGALQLLLQRRLGRAFARPTLLRVHETSGGNPFYALELARALRTDVDLGEPLRVPDTLERLVGARLRGLRGRTRGVLLLAAAHGRLTPALLRAAGGAYEALEPALDADVVELSHGSIRFVHPLLASVLYHGAPAEERRLAHERLASVVDDPLERARHLRLSSRAPDEETAAALAEAAILGRARGAIAAAAELAEHALRLTPLDADADRHRRALAAARGRLESAETRRARELALELLPRTQGEARAEALVMLSDVEQADAHVGRAIELRLEALAVAEQPALRAVIHGWLGAWLRYTKDAETADRHAVRAVELAEQLADDSLRAEALSVLAMGRFRAGDPGALDLVDQAARLVGAVADPRRQRQVILELVAPFVWSFRLDRARSLLELVERESTEEDQSAGAFWAWGMIELRAGRFGRAAEHAERAREISRQYATDDDEPPVLVWLSALVAAHRGELERARALAERSRALASGLRVVRSGQDAVLGLVDLWGGDPQAAIVRFEAAEEDRRGPGVLEPAMFWWRAEYAEALVSGGRLDEAAALVEAWAADAARLGRDAVLAQASRCRGLVAAARGDDAAAAAELERAVAQHQAVGDPFGAARARLAAGLVARRARRQRAARDALEAALAGFEACGALGWAATAAGELGRIGGRRRSEGLTPAEDRVAALVAEGRSNREVASALFLAEHTVEKTLTRVYRKLDVRSRSELARRIVERGENAPGKR